VRHPIRFDDVDYDYDFDLVHHSFDAKVEWHATNVMAPEAPEAGEELEPEVGETP